jgi:4-amino-4-deoxy-L-arabinose transferase-like glycosyltransferase
VLAASVIALVYIACALPKLTTLPRVNVDEPWMLQLAHQLRTTGAITLPMFGIQESFLLQPGYSVIIAPWTALAGEGIYQARLLSAVFGAGILWLTYLVGRSLLGAAAGLGAAMFLAVDSNFLGAVRTTRHDVMSLAFILTALLVATAAIRTGRAFHYALAGALSAVAVLFHANAYWAILAIGVWLALAHGLAVFWRRAAYAYAIGAIAVLSPILLRWREYSRQLDMFVGNITPGLSWSRLAESAAAEPTRYRHWYFGLSTLPGLDPWLLTFQICAAAGAIILARRAWRERGRAPRVAGSTLVLSEVITCVLVFAFMVPNKAHAYLPNLTIGFAWLAGATLATTVHALSTWRRSTITASWTLLLVVLLYTGTAAWRYHRWFAAASSQGLAPYEETAATLQAMVPPVTKQVIAFPTFWLPFRDDPATRFLSVTAVAPPRFVPHHPSFQYRVQMEALDGHPIYVLVDDAHWTPMWQAGGPAAAAWRAFLHDHCSVQAVADGTSYGDVVAYACDPRGRPAVTPWIASATGRWRAAATAMWVARPDDIAQWDRYRPETAVTVRDDGTAIAGDAGAGVCTTAPVSRGESYMLSYAVDGADPGDLVSIAHASRLGRKDTSNADSAVWAALQGQDQASRETAFIAQRDEIRVCFYSELATAFTLAEVRLSRLERADSIAEPHIP